MLKQVEKHFICLGASLNQPWEVKLHGYQVYLKGIAYVRINRLV